MTDTNALLYLLQVANGSFPTGSFAHSYGLETLHQDGRITDARSLADIAHLWLRYGVAASEGGAVAIAFRATRENDFATIAALDEHLTALKLTRETREASMKIGRAFLRTVSSTFGWARTAEYRRATTEGMCAGNFATAFGVAAADAETSATEALLAFLHSTLYGVVGVAARIIPLGQLDAQRVLAESWPQIVDCANIALRLEFEDLGVPAAFLDIASMHHERLYSRLCMS
ncbi:MAG TPA: urease accessory protein UreF [Gemmatimonadaceae bacterium]